MTTRTKATKAHSAGFATGLTTIILGVLAKVGVIPVAPEAAELIAAWQIVVAGIVTGAIGWAAAYLPANVPVVRSLLLLGVAGLALSACETVGPIYDQGRDFAYDRAGNVMTTVCLMSLAGRMDAIDEVNSRNALSGAGWWTPSDCDRDGVPDFNIDPATGLSIRSMS